MTGLGTVSALGADVDGFWDRLCSGACGIRRLPDARTEQPCRIGAVVDGPDVTRYLRRGRAATFQWPRPSVLAFVAAITAIADAGYDMTHAPDRIGLVVGTSVGSLDVVLEMHRHYQATGRCEPQFGFYGFQHFTACGLSSVLDVRGPCLTLTAGCNAGLDAIGAAARLIASGDADAVIAVGTDSIISAELMAVFEATGTLTTRYNDRPWAASRPFDAARDGTVPGEGAAALLLERPDLAAARGARAIARIDGYASRMAGMARQYSHDHPDLGCATAVSTLEACLDSAGWAPDDVDLFSANGSASVIYDPLEASAIHAVFGCRRAVPVYSMKGALGQTGAGTSALQAVAACLSLATGDVPPTLNCDQLDPACAPLDVVTSRRRLAPNRILLHGVGFGGFYYSALGLSRAGPATMSGASSPVARWSRATLRYEPTDALVSRQRPG